MVELSLHSYRLSQLLVELDYIHKVKSNNDFTSLTQAGEWLDIASSIENISLITARHDYSIWMCGNALDYEDKRSFFLSKVITQMTIFNFMWGAFETVTKVINPKPVPKKFKKRRSNVDDAIFYLKTKFDPRPRIGEYENTIHELVDLMKGFGPYARTFRNFKYEPFLSFTGIGLHIVRLIRNEFAHGSTNLPSPQDWGPEKKKERLTIQEQNYTKIIEASSRILLFSIQMMMIQFLNKKEYKVDVLQHDKWSDHQMPVKNLLRMLHKKSFVRSASQLELFERV